MKLDQYFRMKRKDVHVITPGILTSNLCDIQQHASCVREWCACPCHASDDDTDTYMQMQYGPNWRTMAL